MSFAELLALIQGTGVPVGQTGMRMAPAMKPYPDVPVLGSGVPLGLRMAPALGTAESGLQLPVMSPEMRARADEALRHWKEREAGRQVEPYPGALSTPYLQPGLLSGRRG